MTKHTDYTSDEIRQILDMRFNKKFTAKKIGIILNRTESAVQNVLHRYKCKGMYNPDTMEDKDSKQVSPAVETLNTPDDTKQRVEVLLHRPDPEVKPMVIYQQEKLTAREMIKKLYDMGYRIEDNELVCYVKQNVNVKDIING